MTDEVKSLKDLYILAARRFSGAQGLAQIGPSMVNLGAIGRVLADGARYLMKADDPVLTTSDFGGGALNVAYGAEVMADWTDKKVGFYAAIPKVDYGNREGWRALTADPSTMSEGITENSALPDTVEPTLTEISAAPKWVMTRWEITDQAKLRAGFVDGVGDIERILRDYFKTGHIYGNNTDLNTQSGSLASTGFESIDRVVATTSEDQNCTDAANAAMDAGDSDIYSQDRDTSSTADAQVLHNSGTDRVLTLGLMDQLRDNCRTNKDKEGGSFWMTDFDTFRELEALVRDFQTIDYKPFSATINGVRAREGQGGGEGAFTLATYSGDPIIVESQTVSETSGISRLYYVDTDHVKFAVAAPTLYMTTATVAGIQLIHDNLKSMAAYLTVGELRATKFKSSGKIRDLKAS